jgi:hypothetical protein
MIGLDGAAGEIARLVKAALAEEAKRSCGCSFPLTPALSPGGEGA